jgi:hypothetical protein
MNRLTSFDRQYRRALRPSDEALDPRLPMIMAWRSPGAKGICRRQPRPRSPTRAMARLPTAAPRVDAQRVPPNLLFARDGTGKTRELWPFRQVIERRQQGWRRRGQAPPLQIEPSGERRHSRRRFIAAEVFVSHDHPAAVFRQAGQGQAVQTLPGPSFRPTRRFDTAGAGEARGCHRTRDSVVPAYSNTGARFSAKARSPSASSAEP